MSVTTLFNSVGNKKNNQPERRAWSSMAKTTAISAGLLMVAFLVAVGCSKKPGTTASHPAESATSALENSRSQPVALASSTSPAASLSQPSNAGKVVHRRPRTLTYKDSSHGIAFRYARQYRLKAGEGTSPMAFVKPGGTTVAQVELPHNLYPNTDFGSGFFNVSLIENLSAMECEQFTLPNHPEDGAINAGKVKIGATEFSAVEDVSKLSDAKYYHYYEKGTCYEFALGLGLRADQSKEEITSVDREQVFRKLEKMLASVKINPPAVSSVAAEALPGDRKQRSQ